MSPTQKSIASLKKEGWRVAIVEKYNFHAHVRQDLFGFGDLLAVCPTEKPLIVQTTTQDHANARVEKILASPAIRDVLRGGFCVIVHGWEGKKLGVQEIILDPDGKTLRVL